MNNILILNYEKPLHLPLRDGTKICRQEAGVRDKKNRCFFLLNSYEKNKKNNSWIFYFFLFVKVIIFFFAKTVISYLWTILYCTR